MEFVRSPLILRVAYAGILLATALANGSSAQLVMSNLGAINQNFDTLGSSTTLPSYWRVAKASSSPSWSSAASNLDFASNSGQPQTNGTYNWGDSAFTNRALGMLIRSWASTDNFMLRIRNGTSSNSIKSFAIGYSVKQFYRGGAGGQIQLYYSTNGSSWTLVSSTSLSSSDFLVPTGYLFGQPNTLSVPSKEFSVPDVLPNGDIYFRWAFSFSGDGAGYGIDDIWITPVTSSIAPSDFTYQSASGGITITGYTGTAAALTIPSSINGQTVVGIGYNAFRQRTGITLVELPDTVTLIEDGAFSDCTNLSSINLPNGLQAIGDGAFYRCAKLTSVTIPASILYLGTTAFQGCSALTDLTISYSLSQIQILSDTFRDCVSLRNVTIPGSVTAIGDRAFYGCLNLSSVWLQSGVEQLGAEVFQNCYSLSSVTLSSTLKSIGRRAFGDCANLPSIHIGGQVTSIGSEAFLGCSSLSSITVHAANTQYSGLDGALLNKSQTQLLVVPAGKSGAYTVPWGVSSISGAFRGCSELESITLPPTVSGSVYLRDCTGLTSATVPDQLSLSLPSSATLGVLKYTYNENAGVMTITAYEQSSGQAFSVNIPGFIYGFPVTGIGDHAFQWTQLTSVTTPASVTNIGNYAFAGTPLKTATIASGNIGSGAFESSQLTTINLGNGVTGIGDYAFKGTQLTSVTISASVTSIGTDSFLGSSLTAITVAPDNLHYSSLDGVLFNKSQTTLLAFPSGSAGAYSVPSSVTHIGDGAFRSSSLSSILFRGDAPLYLGSDPFFPAQDVFYLPGRSGWSDAFPGQLVQEFRPVAGHAYMTEGRFLSFSWTGTGAFPMNVERSTSLTGSWTVVSPSNTAGAHTDPAPPAGQAFYRAVLP